MATIASALLTPFIPAASTFRVQVTDGTALLESRGTASEPWANAGLITDDRVFYVDNPIASVEYQFVSASGSPVVRADQ